MLPDFRQMPLLLLYRRRLRFFRPPRRFALADAAADILPPSRRFDAALLFECHAPRV